MFKRCFSSLALMLTVVVVTATPWSPPTARASGQNPFSDITDHWAASMITQAVATGYVDGYPDGTFRRWGAA